MQVTSNQLVDMSSFTCHLRTVVLTGVLSMACVAQALKSDEPYIAGTRLLALVPLGAYVFREH